MTKKLRTSHIFLDTEVFISANFQFNSGNLNRLKELSKNGKISIHLTDITKREVEANIEKNVRQTSNSIDRIKKEIKILRNVSSYQPVFYFNKKEVRNELIQQFHDFLSLTGTNIFLTKDVSVESVFEKYFNQQPPFGEGDKKSEFPDAFAITAIENWCRDNKQFIYVISNDGDMKSACVADSYLLSLAKLEELFDIITSEEDELGELAQKLFNEIELNIKENIIDKFEDLGFYLQDCYEGEVHSVEVNSVELLDKYLVESVDDVLVFQVTARIRFSSEFSYPDPDMTYYDREDKQYIVLETIDDTFEETLELPVEVEITFNRDEPHDPELQNVSIETNGSIWISALEDKAYPYK